MSSASMIQLNSKAGHDTHLTKNPKALFFKKKFRQYVDFSIEPSEIPINNAGFGQNTRVEVTKSGDLLVRAWLDMDLTALSSSSSATTQVAYAPNLFHSCINKMVWQIGNTPIDTHTGMWFDIWNEFTLPGDKLKGYNSMIGQENLTELHKGTGLYITMTEDVTGEDAGVAIGHEDGTDGNTVDEFAPMWYLENGAVTMGYNGFQTYKSSHAATTVYLPLLFWFNVNPGLALPFCALVYTPINFSLEMKASTSVVRYRTTPGSETAASTSYITYPTVSACTLWLEEAIIPKKIRDLFASVLLTYIIPQVQTVDYSIVSATYRARLAFNHAVASVFFGAQDTYALDENVHNDFTVCNSSGVSTGVSTISTAQFYIVNTERTPAMNWRYYNYMQPFMWFKKVPTLGYNVYTFSIRGHDLSTPSGTCNFSRVDGELSVAYSTLGASSRTGKLHILATGFNVLFIGNSGALVRYLA